MKLVKTVPNCYYLNIFKFKYSYILVNEIICEDLMKITQNICGNIGTFVLINKFKNSQTT